MALSAFVACRANRAPRGRPILTSAASWRPARGEGIGAGQLHGPDCCLLGSVRDDERGFLSRRSYPTIGLVDLSSVHDRRHRPSIGPILAMHQLGSSCGNRSRACGRRMTANREFTEDTVAALMRTDPRIRYLRQPMSVGMPANLNSAIAATDGDYVANLHDDDAYRPDLLARWIEALGSCRRATLVFNTYEQLASDGSPDRTYRVPLPACFPAVFSSSASTTGGGTSILRCGERLWRVVKLRAGRPLPSKVWLCL
jgi:Glycosyl transferase family 2